jgi:hypothetical protein
LFIAQKVEPDIIFVIAILDCLEESGLLGIFGDFPDLPIGEEGVSHTCKLSLLLSAAGQNLIVRIIQIKLIVVASAAPKRSGCDILEQFSYVFLVCVPLVKSVNMSVCIVR